MQARGIANNICGYLSKFVSNFQIAINPQIIKYYAQGDVAQMNRLTQNNSKYSLYFSIAVMICLCFWKQNIFCNYG